MGACGMTCMRVALSRTLQRVKEPGGARTLRIVVKERMGSRWQ